jgi:putative (di)nucleoside polyphosphate hydrolase
MNNTSSGWYRPNVGIAILNNDNLAFFGKRNDVSTNSWQFPQGGVDDEVNFLKAALREVEEETGITPEKIELIAIMPEKIRYNFPEHIIEQSRKIKPEWAEIVGQEQTWFVFRFLGTEADINLNASKHPEFAEYKWENLDFAIENCVDFKKETYEKVVAFVKSIVGEK